MTSAQQQGADYSRARAARASRLFDIRTTPNRGARVSNRSPADRDTHHQSNYERRRAQIAADIERHRREAAPRSHPINTGLQSGAS